MVFVDTSAWFALFVPTDPDHDRVLRWQTAQSERPITTDFCVDETLTLLLARGESRRAVGAGRWLIEGNRTELLPGCISEGDTLEDARENIREAIALYLEPAEEPHVPHGGYVEEIAV